MFCRVCHYDLRGQTNPKCPECGTSFSPADISTYLPKLLTARDKIIMDLPWWGVRLVLLLFMIGSYQLVPTLFFGCSIGYEWGEHYLNLQAILKEWQDQCHSETINCAFDEESAKRHLRPRLSPISEMTLVRHKFHWRGKFGHIAVGGWGVCVLGAMMGLTFRAKARRRIVMASAFMLVLAILGAFNLRAIAGMRYPGTYAFLDDFEYLAPPFPSVEWDRSFIVACYERKQRGRNQFMVGTADGRARTLDEDSLADIKKKARTND